MYQTLTAFLAGNAVKPENRKIIASQRFIGEDGKPIAWEIAAITAAENLKIRKNCTRSVQITGKRGQYSQELDLAQYQLMLAAKCTVFPDLNDAALQQSYGVMGAEALIAYMLTPGEFDDYIIAVTELCGFQSDNVLIDEAKN